MLGRGIAIVKTLLHENNTVLIRVMNVNYYYVTMKKGPVLGHCSYFSTNIRGVSVTPTGVLVLWDKMGHLNKQQKVKLRQISALFDTEERRKRSRAKSTRRCMTYTAPNKSICSVSVLIQSLILSRLRLRYHKGSVLQLDVVNAVR